MKRLLLLISLAFFSSLYADNYNIDPSKHFYGIYVADSTLVTNCKITKSHPVSKMFYYDNVTAKYIFDSIKQHKIEIENEAIKGQWDAVVNFKITSISDGGAHRYKSGTMIKTQILISGVTILEGVKVALAPECN